MICLSDSNHDWYSRCIVGWKLDDTLATPMVLRALKKAFKTAKPEILNSDQGSQFTGRDYIEYVEKAQ
jgi:putative transposase